MRNWRESAPVKDSGENGGNYDSINSRCIAHGKDRSEMGLIRSGNTALTPMSCDKALTDYLWPIVREIIKTAIENKQNLIIEGCYIPFDWAESFEADYLKHIQYRCLVMSESYIREHFSTIKEYASVIEDRLDDSDCTIECLVRDNAEALKMCQLHHADYVFIDQEYPLDIEKFLKRHFKYYQI